MNETAVAIGTFDGIHIGHQNLINRLIEISKKKKLKSVLVALSKPVRNVPGLLTTVDEKKEILKAFNIDKIIILKNSPEILVQPPELFLTKFLCGRLKAKHLIVGQNFAFGHSRRGTVDWLNKNRRLYNIGLTVIKPVCYHDDVVSSSRVRRLVLEGRVDYANKLLGRFYSIEGMHKHGRKIGRKVGFKTINLEVNNSKLLPHGIFAGLVRKDNKLYQAAVNIGTRPTFFKKGEIVVEINLIGFDGSWPLEKTKVYLCHHIRAENRFKSIVALRRQIAQDIKKIKKYFLTFPIHKLSSFSHQ